MSADAAVATGTVTVLPSLAELGNTVRREHALVVQTGEALVLHAIRAGEALLDAKEQVERGEWEQWVIDHTRLSLASATVYMRIARHQQRVREANVTTLRAAQRLLAREVRPQIHPELQAEARRLHGDGMPKREIAQVLGVSAEQVTYWTNPGSYRKALARTKAMKRRRAAERKALERQKTDAAMRKVGGPRAEAYALARRLEQSLAQARDESKDPEDRADLDAALADLHRCEDRIVKARRAA